MRKQFEQNSILWLALCAAIVFGLCVFSPVSYTNADPAGTLLTAQSLAQNGTLKLDTYAPWNPVSYRFDYINNHLYYLYPIGSPLLVTPIVWAAGLTGTTFWPASQADDGLQNILSALTVAASFLLMYFLAKAYLNPLESFILSGVFTFGTAIVSTMGTALWSTNMSMLLNMASLLLLVQDAVSQQRKLNPFLLGLLLFLAYLCRPSAVLLVPAAILYIFLYRRQHLTWLIGTLALLMLCFMAFSYLEFRQILPPYYRNSDFALSFDLLLKLYANMLSPSRGLLIFSPLLIMTLIGAVYYARTLYKDPIFQLAAVWFFAHFLLISSWKVWWGGQSFGPRLFADILPALLIIQAIIWKIYNTRSKSPQNKTVYAAACVLVLASVFINSYQGMFNPATATWNDGPAVKFMDWRYPEFLANPRQIAVREVEYNQQRLPVYSFGNLIAADSPQAVFENWYDPETVPQGSLRWSNGFSSSIYIRLASEDVDPGHDYNLKVRLGGFDYAKVRILFNGTEIGLTPFHKSDAESFSIQLPGKIIQPGKVNQISFVSDLSNAIMGSVELQKDERMRGLIFYSLMIQQ